jgi:hypothetical protein
MDIGKILSTVGGTVLKNVVPGAGIVIDLVNGFLPDDKKLDIDTATGTEIANSVSQLPSDQQATILSKQIDVEIEDIKGFTSRFQAAMEADKTGNTTRPQIALMMARVVSFTVIVSISILAVATINKDSSTVDKLSQLWPFILSIIATPTALLRAYFAMRTKEKVSRLQSASDQPVSGVGSIISQVISKFVK